MSSELVTLGLLWSHIDLLMFNTRPCFRIITQSRCVRVNDTGAKGLVIYHAHINTV